MDRDPLVEELLERATPRSSPANRWADVLDSAGTTRSRPLGRWALPLLGGTLAMAFLALLFVRLAPSGQTPSQAVVAPEAVMPEADLTRKRLLISTSPDGMLVTSWTAPRRGGGSCHWVSAPEELLSYRCSSQPALLPSGRATGTLVASPSVRGGVFVLIGEAADDVAEVELRFESGETLRTRVVEGVFLAAIPQIHTSDGHRQSMFLTYDGAGRELWRQAEHADPGWRGDDQSVGVRAGPSEPPSTQP